MAKIILWGTGVIAEVAHHYLTTDSEHEICAVCVDRPYLTAPSFKDIPVVAFDEVARLFPPADYRMAMPMGYKKLNKPRAAKFEEVRAAGYKFISYISSRSSCDAARVGENVFVFSQNDIQPFVEIGDNVIIWATSGIGHHTKIGDHCFLASPKISGQVTIGRNVFLGTNATVADNVTIGDYSFIGAGAVVLKSLSPASVVAVKPPKLLPLNSHELEDML